MSFTSEQDRFLIMVHFRSGTLNPDINWSYSLQSCIEQFMQQYPDEMIEYNIFKQRKYRLVHRFKTKNCICKGKSTGRSTVLTKNVIENIQERINQSPKKAVSQLSQQAGLSSQEFKDDSEDEDWLPGEALVEDLPSDMGTADDMSEGEGKSDTESDESENENQAAGMPAVRGASVADAAGIENANAYVAKDKTVWTARVMDYHQLYNGCGLLMFDLDVHSNRLKKDSCNYLLPSC
ncbi:hypothetical protein FQA39_LY13433 [Lamprigera yunnana]|nr:hypothetical protein FQA39_LY13433 [Lamprigera yunnana]